MEESLAKITDFYNRFERKFRRLSSSAKTHLQHQLEEISRKRGFWYYENHKPPIPHPISLTPLVLPKDLIPQFHRLARLVLQFQSLLPELWLNDFGEIRKIFLIDARTAEWIKKYYRKHPKPDDLFIRLDVGLKQNPETGEIQPVLFENNSLSLAGLLNHTVGVDLLKNIVWPRVFGSQSVALRDPPNLIDFAFDWISSRFQKPGFLEKSGHIFILDEPRYLNEGSEFRFLKEEWKARGLHVTHGHSGQLKESTPIDLVWRDLSYQELILQNDEGQDTIFQLMAEDRMLQRFASEFVEKGILECFSNPLYARFFSEEDWEFLQKTVPWTRVLWSGREIDLFKFARENKVDLLIKPNRGAEGEGIMIGKKVTDGEWQQRLAEASEHPSKWVLQEFQETLTFPMIFLQNGTIRQEICYAAIGLFYYHDRLGLHSRISTQNVVNVAQGGALACVFLGTW